MLYGVAGVVAVTWRVSVATVDVIVPGGDRVSPTVLSTCCRDAAPSNIDRADRASSSTESLPACCAADGQRNGNVVRQLQHGFPNREKE